ncbi:MAG: hypothetical protein V7644_1330 [Actinomycetota bacterium]|jgi:uncharacterized protein YbjT (DUF2867 family)
MAENAVNKVIAVVGATGAQGGGVIRAIAADAGGGFAGRALTREPSSEAAKSLAAADVEVVQADLDDRASLERAFAGAHGVFGVTNFWEHYSPDKEIEQARNIAAAAKAADVRHVIWSTLEDTRQWVPLDDDRMPTLNGKWKVPHYDGKGEAEKEFADVPTTLLRTSFYWENMIYFGMGPQRGEDGRLTITFPIGDKRLPGMGAEDIGKTAYAIFKSGNDYIGKVVSIAGEHLSGAEMAAGLSEALGEAVQYTAIEPAVYRGLGFPGAEDLGNMFQITRDFEPEYAGPRDVQRTRALNPALKDFRTWLAENKSRIPLG